MISIEDQVIKITLISHIADTKSFLRKKPKPSKEEKIIQLSSFLELHYAWVDPELDPEEIGFFSFEKLWSYWIEIKDTLPAEIVILKGNREGLSYII